jgi:hypothetical protein
MFVACAQLPIQSTGTGGQLALQAASTICPGPGPDLDPQSRAHGPTQAASSDPNPVMTGNTMSRGSDSRHKTGASRSTIPDQQKPSEAPVAMKKKIKKESTTSGQPEGSHEAKRPNGEFSHVDASPGPRAVRVVRACAGCEVTAKASAQGKLKECSSCRSVRYCGRECQKADWPAHKATCKRPQAAQGSTSSCFLSTASEL